MIVLLPYQVEKLTPHGNKGFALGSVIIVGSLCSIVTAPIAGSYSDSCRHPLDKRRPFMIVGTVIASIALVVMALSTSLSVFSL